MSLRLAGFEVFDVGAWLYGSGFPKSLDVAKAIDARDKLGPQREQQYAFTTWIRKYCTLSSTGIDKLLGTNGMGRHYTDVPPGGKQPEIAVREHFEKMRPYFKRNPPPEIEQAVDVRENHGIGQALPPGDITTAYSDEAKAWEGFGTALKPAYEPIILARKPLDGTYANNIMTHGCGALNIDGCRIPSESTKRRNTAEMGYHGGNTSNDYETGSDCGRWPANVMHDGCLPEPMDRYFYCTKASKADREAGLASFEPVSAGQATGGRKEGSDGLNSPRAGAGRTGGAKNTHPTVKPTDLMRWLCRLVTPPGGLVADPFTGSGSTARAAALEGFAFIGWELDPEYHKIATARAKI